MMVVARFFDHLTLFLLSGYPQHYNKYSRRWVVCLGGIATAGRVVECYLFADGSIGRWKATMTECFVW